MHVNWTDYDLQCVFVFIADQSKEDLGVGNWRICEISFPPTPSIQFIHNGDAYFSSRPMFPRVNWFKIVNCIKLPLHVWYQLFKEQFELCIRKHVWVWQGMTISCSGCISLSRSSFLWHLILCIFEICNSYRIPSHDVFYISTTFQLTQSTWVWKNIDIYFCFVFIHFHAIL